ncbi:MAG: hypothetical protein M3Z10_12235 [Gemmatimonadota bacterium]|nr:hypothetical protein [Gemmatimonadota bacterium]
MSPSEALHRVRELRQPAPPQGFRLMPGAGIASCRLVFRDGAVQYIRERGGGWELAASDIALVGEYTTADGPFIDDYFFAFVRNDGAVFQASFYAAGGNATLDALGAALGGRITAGLCNSATWRSRVIWPAALEGLPLFELRERTDGSIWHRLQRVMGMGATDAVLTVEVERYLANCRT